MTSIYHKAVPKKRISALLPDVRQAYNNALVRQDNLFIADSIEDQHIAVALLEAGYAVQYSDRVVKVIPVSPHYIGVLSDWQSEQTERINVAVMGMDKKLLLLLQNATVRFARSDAIPMMNVKTQSFDITDIHHRACTTSEVKVIAPTPQTISSHDGFVYSGYLEHLQAYSYALSLPSLARSSNQTCDIPGCYVGEGHLYGPSTPPVVRQIDSQAVQIVIWNEVLPQNS